MIQKERLNDHSKSGIWQKYCGFLDLSSAQIMQIQKHMILERLKYFNQSRLVSKVIGDINLKTIDDFRQQIPLTTYADYRAYIGDCQEEHLSTKPACWARTSGRGGTPKWIPYTEEMLNEAGKHGLITLILACASNKGDVLIKNGMHILQNIPPPPYVSGISISAVEQYIDMSLIPPKGEYENQPFQKRIEDGFKIALRSGVDVLASMTSVLLKMGESFTESGRKIKFSRGMLNPPIMFRFISAFLKSKMEKRSLLPKDLWPLKGLICYGMDTGIYRDRIKYYWGKEPLEIYGSTETSLMAIQAWNKKAMTFYPYSVFFEFIPEDEWLKNREDKTYQPKTLLLDELEPGKIYEVIITTLHGTPLLRYRLGDLIKIISLEDEAANIKIPQMVFKSRADDLIDIGGFTRLDEKTLWQAIRNVGIKHNGWSARKEYEADKPVVSIYIEIQDESSPETWEQKIHDELVSINKDYRDLQNMLDTRPLRIKPLSPGSFTRYYESKQAAGADLAHLKPPQMNPLDSEIETLTGGSS